MNLEKIVLLCVLTLTVTSGVYLNANRREPDSVGERSIKQDVQISQDFNLARVLDDSPFQSYYSEKKRDPFVPFHPPVKKAPRGGPGKIKKVNKEFEKPPVKVEPPKKVVVAKIPDKPIPVPPKIEKLSKETVKKDQTLAVYLIGFAKTFTDDDMTRKAILADKKTGKIYTVAEGETLMGMSIRRITPNSIILRLANGRNVEFLNDTLKE